MKNICKSFGNGRKVMKLCIITLQFQLKTNKQNNLLILTVSCEKSCFIRRKKNNNNKEINLDLNKKLARFITHLKNTSTTRQSVKKTHTKQKDGIYNTYYPTNG